MVYLIHFSKPISPNHSTQHYLGYAKNVEARFQDHVSGYGARLCQVAIERSIEFKIVRTWDGGRKLERRLKNQKNAPRLCPVCSGE